MVNESTVGLNLFVKVSRQVFTCNKPAVRNVYVTELSRNNAKYSLDSYFADTIPFYYRECFKIIQSLNSGYFLSTIKETLAKLPTSESFIKSHFGEIVGSAFSEEILGLKKIYSKLSLLTAENANAYKMDLVLFDPKTNPVEFIFAEVKSSPKHASECYPAKHDKSCYADIFQSLNEYSDNDLAFDLGAAKDRLDILPEPYKTRVKEALKPYSNKVIQYTALAVIDTSTKNDGEISLLATRKNKKGFDIDLVCIEEFAQVAKNTYKILEEVRQACSQ